MLHINGRLNISVLLTEGQDGEDNKQVNTPSHIGEPLDRLKNYLEDLSIDERMILKLMLKELIERTWTALIWS